MAIQRNSPRPKGVRILGFWAKHGPMSDPELFLRPDPELEALMVESVDPVSNNTSPKGRGRGPRPLLGVGG